MILGPLCRASLLYSALLASAVLIAASCVHRNVVAKTPAPLGDREIHNEDIDRDYERGEEEDARRPAPWEPPENPQARKTWFQGRKRSAATIHEVQAFLGTANGTTPRGRVYEADAWPYNAVSVDAPSSGRIVGQTDKACAECCALGNSSSPRALCDDNEWHQSELYSERLVWELRAPRVERALQGGLL